MPHKKAAPKQVPKQVNNQLNESSESGDHNESAAGDGQFNMNSQCEYYTLSFGCHMNSTHDVMNTHLELPFDTKHETKRCWLLLYLIMSCRIE